MTIIYNKQKITITYSVISNLIWSIVYFKQLFYPNAYSYIINLSGVALLPFIYFIAALFILTIPEKGYNLLKSPGIIFSIIFSAALVALFLFIGKYNYIFLLYFVLLEPLKVRFINHGSTTYLKNKYIALAIVSFLLLAISTALPKMNATVNATAMWMGGFYFLLLIVIDYKLPSLIQKIKVK